MLKFVRMLEQDFESSSVDTEQFKEFVRTFKKEFKGLLKNYITKIEFSKGHFEISGFFTLLLDDIYYFNLGDVRWNKDQMLIRKAEHYKDWTGGQNSFILVNDKFKENLYNYLGVK